MNRHLYIGNLPSSTTEQNLQTIFPDAVHLAIAFNEESIPKGYAIAEMESEEAVERAVVTYRDIECEGNRLIILATWSRPPKGLMDYRARQDVLKRVRNLKFRVKNRRARFNNPIAIQKMENEMRTCKQRLDRDCKVREELGLPSPPDVIHREKLLAEQKLKKEEEDKDKKEKGEDSEEKEDDGNEEKEEKKEKKSPAKNSSSRTPQRRDSQRSRGNSGRFQSSRSSYSSRGSGRGRDQSRSGSRGGQMGQRRSFGGSSSSGRSFSGGTSGDSYQPRGQNMQQAMSLLKNIQDMILSPPSHRRPRTQSANYSGSSVQDTQYTSGSMSGSSSFGQRSHYASGSGSGGTGSSYVGSSATGFDNYSSTGGYNDNFSDSYTDNYNYGGGSGSGYSQGNKRRLSSESYSYGSGNKRGPGQGNRQRQNYGGKRW